MSRSPITADALDDRQAFVGTSGSGKTYGAGIGVEQLLVRKARVAVVDPLGVWHGLRLKADGRSASRFPVVIFGGRHGDLALREGAGRLVGETVAGMAESCILDLSELGTKSAERRFMLGFLDALYRKASGDPLHLIFDEADLWAPQKAQEPQLQALMENIVRRGRVKGFIPWLITQRPAVLSKDVLSQADALVAFKLTASQDRDALGAWIEGQADRGEEKRILARLPQLERGQAIVWNPGKGTLTEARFPAKATFDSSATPTRGEARPTVTLKPLDLGRLAARMAKVEAEAKADDPKTLKAEIARLQGELRTKGSAPDKAAIEAAERRGVDMGFAFARQMIVGPHLAKVADVLEALSDQTAALTRFHDGVLSFFSEPLPARMSESAPQIATPPRPKPQPPAPLRSVSTTVVSDLTPTKQRIVDAIAWAVATMRNEAPLRNTVAFLADASPSSSAFANNLGALRTAGLIDYPAAKRVALTEAGAAIAATPAARLTHEDMLEALGAQLQPAFMRILRAVSATYPNAISRAELAAAVEASPTSSAFANNLGRLSTFGLITYPASGQVLAADVLFPGGAS